MRLERENEDSVIEMAASEDVAEEEDAAVVDGMKTEGEGIVVGVEEEVSVKFWFISQFSANLLTLSAHPDNLVLHHVVASPHHPIPEALFPVDADPILRFGLHVHPVDP
jgi:hypothetical protein